MGPGLAGSGWFWLHIKLLNAAGMKEQQPKESEEASNTKYSHLNIMLSPNY